MAGRLKVGRLEDWKAAGLDGSSLALEERQLVLIARAMVQQAKILIMDEPSANLDYGNRTRVMQTVKNLAREGYAIIQSTHDPDQAFLYSDKILALHDGGVLAWGSPKEVMTSELISKLYHVKVEMCSLKEDEIRVCIPMTKG